ncbi:MAG: RICIN domain-containing protein [Ruminococcus sp.]|uniref:RICIN domain-containing protein n=1 Tax=Ruminococcus sp. TaxID=41978 RepID=UPI0025DC0DCF|nr:RICIN domain-containing protein [Ruminococcus sp.]MBO4865576.1 RICIN domain-containing protein [Ruminococcus sp.]
MKKLTKPFVSIFLTIVIVISILPMSAFAASYRTDYWNFTIPSRTLSLHIIGNDVKWLQCALNELIIRGDKNGIRINAPIINVDGNFRNSTNTALLTFQSRYNLATDGKFGPASRSKMLSVLRYYNPTPIPQPDQQQNSGSTYSAVEPNVPEGVYYIRNKKSNKYLDVRGGSSYNGAELVQFPFHGDANQQFQILYENGFYKIYTMLGGNRRCLDLCSASDADTNGTVLKLYDASYDYQEQNFRFRDLGDGSYEIGSVNSYGNKVLEVRNSSYDDCATVQIWQCDNSRINDDWYLEPVNDHNTSVNKVRQAQMNVKSRKQYDSIEDAAKDFIMAYDGMSVYQNREYGTSIVPLGNGKYTFTHIIWGPLRGNSADGELGECWDQIDIPNAVAWVHTHGQEIDPANLVFSPDDMVKYVDNIEHFDCAYLGNANGEIYVYKEREVETQHSYEEFKANRNKYSGHYITTYSRCVTDYWYDTSFNQNNDAGIYRLG